MESMRARQPRSPPSSASRPMSGASPTASVRVGAASTRDARIARRRIDLDATFPDRVVELGGLAKRRDPELAIEQGHERAVLADRAGPVARSREQVHDPSLTGLVEGIQVHASAGRLDRAGRIAALAPRGRQPVEQVPDDVLDPHGPGRLPVVEVGAVADREPGQERSASQACRGFEIVAPIGRGQAFELEQVHPRRVGIDGHAGSIDRDADRPDRTSQRREGPAEGAAGRLVVGVRPEHRGEFIPSERPALGGDERDDRERLPGIDGDRAVADDDLERSEEVDPELRHRRHRVTVPRTCSFP